MKSLFTIFILLTLLPAAAAFGASTVLYRFTDKSGELVYSYTLPPEQAKDGYEKIDPQTGQVLESVAAQLPPRQLAEKQRREQALKECRDELDRIYQLYGTESDIAHAREETLENLDTRVGQLQANLRQAIRERNRLQSQAADAERSGREIPRSLLGNIERSRSQIATLEGEIEQRQQEQEEANARYRRDLERFRDGTCPEPGTVADAGRR